MAPIIEEDEPLMVFEQTMYPPVGAAGAASTTATLVEMIPKIEELPPQENEERALVLFKPMDNTPFLHSPASFSVTSDILAGLKSMSTTHLFSLTITFLFIIGAFLVLLRNKVI